MIVRTYTNMWNEEKKLYTIYDVTLPTPISFRQIGLFLLGAIVWMPLMFIANIPITNPWGAVSWFSFPVLLAIFGNQKLFDGKSLFEWASSMIGFFFEPKVILDGEGVSTTRDKVNIDREGIALSKNPEVVFSDEDSAKKKKKKPAKIKRQDIVHVIDLEYKLWTREPLGRN